MTLRIGLLPLAATMLLALAAPAGAATYLGSPDASAEPDGYACADCPAGRSMGIAQFALRGASIEAPEDGVVVSAGVRARRIAGTAPPELAVLRPGDEDMSVVATAPLPVSSATGELQESDELHLPMQRGDSLGFLFRTGEVELGVRARRLPDGAFTSFGVPCDPCGSDGGTGTELLLDAVLEPDVDADGLGDESQDADGGGLGPDWEDDWFDDFEEGDELDEDIAPAAGRAARGRLRLLDVDRRRGARKATLLVRVPRAGRVRAAIARPADRRTGAGPFLTLLTGEKRARHAGRMRLRVKPTEPARRVLARHGRLRTKVIVSLTSASQPLKVLMRSARL